MSRLPKHSTKSASVDFVTMMPQFGVAEYAARHDICESHRGDEENRSIYSGDPMNVSHDEDQQVTDHRNPDEWSVQACHKWQNVSNIHVVILTVLQESSREPWEVFAE